MTRDELIKKLWEFHENDIGITGILIAINEYTEGGKEDLFKFTEWAARETYNWVFDRGLNLWVNEGWKSRTTLELYQDIYKRRQ